MRARDWAKVRPDRERVFAAGERLLTEMVADGGAVPAPQRQI